MPRVYLFLKMYQGVKGKANKSRRLPTQKIKIEKGSV
jgi:hypothetical protein